MHFLVEEERKITRKCYLKIMSMNHDTNKCWKSNKCHGKSRNCASKTHKQENVDTFWAMEWTRWVENECNGINEWMNDEKKKKEFEHITTARHKIGATFKLVVI